MDIVLDTGFSGHVALFFRNNLVKKQLDQRDILPKLIAHSALIFDITA